MTDQAQRIMYVFPGQGSQYRGIGSDLHERHESVRRLYERAGDALGYDIARLSFADPDGHIDLTRYTQPVLLTHSIACLEVFRELGGGAIAPVCAGGHSLGEYSALVAAGALEFETALALVARRGELMGEHGEGEMAAIPVELDDVRPIAEKHYCGIAACNLPDQTVVGGRGDDLDRVGAEIEQTFPRKRPVRLKTEGAFHTYYMVAAARHFRPVLEAAEMAQPFIRVLSNYSGGFHEGDVAALKARLFLQLFHPVLWQANLQAAAEGGVNAFVEFGGGIGKGETPAQKRPNLEGILKKTFRGAERPPAYHAVINGETLEQTVEALLYEDDHGPKSSDCEDL